MTGSRALFPTLLLLVVATLTVSPVSAQVEDGDDGRVARGLSSPTAYEFDQLDSINLFNGSLTLVVPLGIEYPLRDGFGYRFVLTYNSNLWRFEQEGNGEQDPIMKAFVDPRSNAGLGWRLSFGELRDGTGTGDTPNRWALWEGDGSKRFFAPVSGMGTNGVQYTQDGSFLRLDTATSPRRVESPDGTYRLFDDDGRLTEMGDPFGNFMRITYDATGWRVTDSHGRTHRVDVVDDDRTESGYRIEKVTLSAFGGRQAVYDLRYATRQITLPKQNVAPLSRPYPTLCSVVLPQSGDTSSACLTEQAFSMAYQDIGGELTRLTLPTLGGYAFTWTEYKVSEGSIRQNPMAFQTGLASKTAFLAGGEELGRWEYTPNIQRPPDIQAEFGADPAAGEYLRRVTDPEGNDTVHFFHYPSEGSPGGYPLGPPLVDGEGLRLSRREYEGTSTGGQPLALRSHYVEYNRTPSGPIRGNPRIVGEKTVFHRRPGVGEEERWLAVSRSDYDGLGHFRRQETSGNFAGENRRVSFTNYNPGSGSLDCDGGVLGDETCTGAITIPEETDEWLLEMWDLRRSLEGPGNTWQFEQLRCWDEETGFLTRVRVPTTAGSRSTTDLVTVRARDAFGNPAREKFFGGDFEKSAPAAHACGQAVTGAPDYELVHTWDDGVLATSRYPNAPHLETDRDIDASTGLVEASRDRSGFETTYRYDLLGRITRAQPQEDQGARTELDYGDAEGTTPTRITTTKMTGLGGIALAQSRVVFDGLGRLSRERVMLPSGEWSTRRTLYNALGWTTSVSEWAEGGPSSHSTEYQDFDAFGRAGKITPPDGAAHAVELDYEGVERLTRSVRLAMRDPPDQVSEKAVDTVETYDRFGRLHSVSERSGTGEREVTTSYVYDGRDRLVSVRVHPAGTNPNDDQVRTFSYDNRGFLTRETHPESGVTRYCDYDARGHARRVHESNAGCSRALVQEFDLVYDYDPFERLVAVSERRWVSSKIEEVPLLEYDHWAVNAPDPESDDPGSVQWSLGKLRTATRFNESSVGAGLETVIVTEHYAYGGLGGRTSTRTTSMEGSFGFQAFTQAWEWSLLGEPTEIVYPRRAGPCATAPPISVPRRYTNGFLTSMPGWAREITYWGNQSLRSVHHGNDRVYWLGLDEHDQRRPRYIALNSDPLAPPATVFDFEYDGAGNVKRWFANRYAYDRANRIEWMTLGSTEKQTYEYDDFGNLVDIERDGQVRYARRIPVDKKTNRLTSASYDAAGNVVVPPGGGTIFDWSGLGTMSWRNDPHGNGRTEYLYTADGERIGIYDHGQRQWTWRLRDLDGKLLREWRGGSESPLVFLDGFESGNLDLWTQDRSPACDDLHWVRDSVHRGGALLASYHWSTGVLHHHPDHLGSPILTTRGPIEEDYTAFFAYGEELDRDPGIGSVSVLRFTGHERDPNQEGAEDAWEDDLDYMHARYHSPVWGRFMSVDPARSAKADEPQSWNRYQYARNNPVAYVDPDGRVAGLVKKGVKLLIKGGDVGATFGGMVTDARVLLGKNVGLGSRLGAGVSLISEIWSPVSVRDGKAIARVVTSARKTDIVEHGARGRLSEARVLDEMGLQGQKGRVSTAEGTSIPDALTDDLLVEVKDTKAVYRSKQARIQTEAAAESGRTSVLVTGRNTCVSGPCENAYDVVIRRDDLGPP